MKLKLRLQIVLLLLILGLVSFPYLDKGYQTFSDWRLRVVQQQKMDKELKEKQISNEKIDELLKKNNIHSISNNGVPSEVFKYVKTKKEVDSNKDGFYCEKPFTYISTSQYFPETDKQLKQLSYDFFLKGCVILEETKSFYVSFNNEKPTIKKLISENINSDDKTIQTFISKLNDSILYLDNLGVR